MQKTLAQTIIFGDDKDLMLLLRYGPVLNEIDEYGYTPLIQGAIVNSVSKSKLLLQSGAEVDCPDLTGRTALHWAASNGNCALCDLLLQHGANPNLYSYAAQPILAVPWLKKHKAIYQLLFEHGASLDFAQDFINAKVLGHRFELEGRIDVVDTQNTFIEVEFEGFYTEFSLNMITSSIVDFRNNFGGKKLRNYFAKIDVIIKALHNAAELLKYQNYLIDIDKYRKQIGILLDQEPLIIPISFEGHAITLIKFWEWIIRCDRGEYGREHGTVIIYYMRNPHCLTKSFLLNLIYKRQTKEYINNELIDLLGLQLVWRLPLSPQSVGNCTWANVEAVLSSMMFIFLLEDHGGREPDLCQKEALSFYKNWVEWDKNRSLHFCVESFYDANPSRKAAKAALLAAILFQTCKYEDYNDHQKAEKIFPILTLPDYKYIIKSYIKVFSQNPKNELLKNLYNFFDDFGIEI